MQKDKQNSKSSAPLVDSLATALGLLNYFTIREPELSLSELSEKSGLYKSRIHRLCATLVASDFLIRMPNFFGDIHRIVIGWDIRLCV